MQQIFNTGWKVDVTAHERNQQNQGFLKPGRYFGFDELAEVSITATHFNAEIRHSLTGITMIDEAQVATNELWGGVMMPIGSSIKVNLIENIAIDKETAIPMRYDLIILEHNFTLAVPQPPVTISVIKGGPVPPTLPDPITQVILGVVEVPQNATAFSELTWKPNTSAVAESQLQDLMAQINAQQQQINNLIGELDHKVGTEGNWQINGSLYIQSNLGVGGNVEAEGYIESQAEGQDEQ